jgi:cupin fold WbuC family metalloprotein
MKKIDILHIKALTIQARANERKRKNMNYHVSDEDLIQRMLNAFEPGTYVHPHTHQNPDKREVFIILTGRLLVIFFDDEGNIIRHVILDRESGIFGVEIAPGEWHTATGLEEGTVVYEIKDGPYNAGDDKNFASWAPNEGESEASLQLNLWLKELGVEIMDYK